MIEQAEILEHDADAAAQIGDRILAELRGVPVEKRDEAARRLQRQQNEAQAAWSCRRRTGPVRNWNECGSISKLMSRKISPPIP